MKAIFTSKRMNVFVGDTYALFSQSPLMHTEAVM